MEKNLFILEEDWKNLIILDACRYDYFKDLCVIPGKLELRLSLADCTVDFVNANFKDRDCQNIVYFNAIPTANYQNYMKGQDIWKIKEATVNPFNVVLPDFFRKQIQAKLNLYPSTCRFIFHFLQPHYPLIYEPEDSPLRQPAGTIFDANHCLIYNEKYGWDRIKKAYTDNLKGVLAQVIELIPRLYPGKTVITADHGELLGRDNRYGHGPGGIKPEYNEVWEVPWFVVD